MGHSFFQSRSGASGAMSAPAAPGEFGPIIRTLLLQNSESSGSHRRNVGAWSSALQTLKCVSHRLPGCLGSNDTLSCCPRSAAIFSSIGGSWGGTEPKAIRGPGSGTLFTVTALCLLVFIHRSPLLFIPSCIFRPDSRSNPSNTSLEQHPAWHFTINIPSAPSFQFKTVWECVPHGIHREPCTTRCGTLGHLWPRRWLPRLAVQIQDRTYKRCSLAELAGLALVASTLVSLMGLIPEYLVNIDIREVEHQVTTCCPMLILLILLILLISKSGLPPPHGIADVGVDSEPASSSFHFPYVPLC